MNNIIRPWLGLLLLLLPFVCRAETYALVIGINAYPDPVGKDGKALTDDQGTPIHARLRGAVNDANSIRQLMTTKYGLPESHVRELTDSAASEQGVLDGFKWLFQSASAGDQIVFYFSGHGGRFDDPKQPDGYEGVIVLADKTYVPGSIFGELARTLAANGVNATFIFDSCYSGAMSRDARLRSKYYESVEMLKKAKKLSSTEFQHALAPANSVEGQSSTSPGSYAFLFASKRDQSASDLSGSGKHPAHGVFTLVLELVIQDDPKVSLKEMYSLFVETLAKLKFNQVPNFETSAPARSEKPLVRQ